MLDTDYPFDVTNRAYQRFLTLASDHFEVIGWDNATTGRPTMLTLVDIGSRDAVSLALLDTAEDRQPHTLLAVTSSAVLTLHRPIAGRAAAVDYAPHLAPHDTGVAATTPVTLHHPDQPRIACDEWLAVPPDIASAARTTAPITGSVAMVLLDRERAQLAVVGPFAGENDAQAWQADADGWPRVDRLLISMRPPTPHDT